MWIFEDGSTGEAEKYLPPKEKRDSFDPFEELTDED